MHEAGGEVRQKIRETRAGGIKERNTPLIIGEAKWEHPAPKKCEEEKLERRHAQQEGHLFKNCGPKNSRKLEGR